MKNGLFDLGGHAEGLHGDRGAFVHLGPCGDLFEHEAFGLLEVVCDERFDAVRAQGGRGAFEPLAARGHGERAVGREAAARPSGGR